MTLVDSWICGQPNRAVVGVVCTKDAGHAGNHAGRGTSWHRIRPPKWRVECPQAGRFAWTVRSPRGVATFTARERAAALQIARSMAAVDDLLARVAKLERNPAMLGPFA